MKKLPLVILVIVTLVAVVTGCSRAPRYDSRLVAADSLMHDAPDSALAIIDAVSLDSLATEADIDKVLGKLDGVTERTARFRTAIALLQGDEMHMFEGQVEGVILTERHGTGGFGYDSIFQPLEGDGSTFAQMSPEDKNRISHRGRAVARLVEYLTSQS